MTKLLSKLFPPKTPDQELVDKIRQNVSDLRALCQEASKRNIIVWLKEYSGRTTFVRGKYLQFDEAHRSNDEKF